MVRAGLGMTFLPRYFAEISRRDDFVVCRVCEPQIHRNICLVSRTGVIRPPAARRFGNLVLEHMPRVLAEVLERRAVPIGRPSEARATPLVSEAIRSDQNGQILKPPFSLRAAALRRCSFLNSVSPSSSAGAGVCRNAIFDRRVAEIAPTFIGGLLVGPSPRGISGTVRRISAGVVSGPPRSVGLVSLSASEISLARVSSGDSGHCGFSLEARLVCGGGSGAPSGGSTRPVRGL